MFRLHLAVRAYQELIQHIALLQVSEDENLRDSAKIIKGNGSVSCSSYILGSE
jgi:hypothetical protein